MASKRLTLNFFAKHLWSSDIPDPDLLIRTSGEMRISNFLLWQLAYAEIIVTPELWPDFDGKTLRRCIQEFCLRERRFWVNHRTNPEASIISIGDSTRLLMLLERIRSAAILLPAALFVLWLEGPLLIFVSLAVYVLINFEFYSVSRPRSQREAIQLTLGSTLLPVSYLIWGAEGLFAGLILAIIASSILQIICFEGSNDEFFLNDFLPLGALGLCYTGVLGTALVACASQDGGGRTLIWLLLIVVFSDTCAYFGGRLIGGAKLVPRISPHKTIAGAIFGFVGAILGGYLTGGVLEFPTSDLWLLGISAIAGVLAQFGDLAESMIKRTLEVKDFGTLIPGHGGLLDRIDSLLFSAPLLLVI